MFKSDNCGEVGVCDNWNKNFQVMLILLAVLYEEFLWLNQNHESS